ncbi:acetolactate decarboxylase [Mycolicibacterium stellerae]|uniref:acetolactate decarboxylase n=1 Tax=Mycolicibacterium stellerae TaxID=2358193 RepID=UPI0013DE6B45|nr:acetolactate decarboxylase [Mycolicibacterium stellerae]
MAAHLARSLGASAWGAPRPHHLHANGSVNRADGQELTPFAAVTWFHADQAFDIDGPTDRNGLTAAINDKIESANLIYAIRITGQFSAIHTRTVTKQDPPYVGMTEATKNQRETVLDDTEGVMAGFRMPDYEQGVTVAGYHLHYLDHDHTRGGHVLDFVMTRARVEISMQSDLHLSLTTAQFLHAHLDRGDIDADVSRVEGGRSTLIRPSRRPAKSTFHH